MKTYLRGSKFLELFAYWCGEAVDMEEGLGGDEGVCVGVSTKPGSTFFPSKSITFVFFLASVSISVVVPEAKICPSFTATASTI